MKSGNFSLKLSTAAPNVFGLKSAPSVVRPRVTPPTTAVIEERSPNKPPRPNSSKKPIESFFSNAFTLSLIPLIASSNSLSLTAFSLFSSRFNIFCTDAIRCCSAVIFSNIFLREPPKLEPISSAISSLFCI